MASSNVGIRGYADFHCPRPTSLYSYKDEEKTRLIHIGGAQTIRELVTSTSFFGRDRAVLTKPHFIFGDAINTKDFLSLPTCHLCLSTSGGFSHF